MTELVHTQYSLRLLADFVSYDPDRGEHLWREFPKDKIVVDRDTIEFLESHNAPVEKIDAMTK
jgi:hypothetical protein